MVLSIVFHCLALKALPTSLSPPCSTFRSISDCRKFFWATAKKNQQDEPKQYMGDTEELKTKKKCINCLWFLPTFSAATPAVKFWELGLTLKVAPDSEILRCKHKNAHFRSDQQSDWRRGELIQRNHEDASPVIGHYVGRPVAPGWCPPSSTLWVGGQNLYRSCLVHHGAFRGLTKQRWDTFSG